MNLLHIAKISGKVGCGKAARQVLNAIYHPRIPKIKVGADYLHSIHSDIGSSCICLNCISERPKYDLLIIVPVYNVEEYLKECIDSIISQKTNYSYQLVIVNDGSTDGSGMILNEYKGHNNIVVIEQENRGLSASRNRALEYIDSRYVMFVDSDDRLLPGAIESLMNAAIANDADIVEGGYKTFCGGKILSVFQYDSGETHWDRMNGYAWCKVYRSSLFANFRFPVGYWYEDTSVWMVLYQMACKNYHIPDIVYDYRQNTKSITHNSKGNIKAFDSYYVTMSLLKDTKSIGLEMDSSYLCALLGGQICLNAYRIHSLDDIKITYSHFEMCKEILSMLPDDIDRYELNPKARQIYESLIGNDYKKFILTCLF